MKKVKGLPRNEKTLLSHIQLPISKQKVTIKPFNVGHRKLFTLVKTSPTPAEIIDVIITVADAVSGISTVNLPTADMEKIFIESRMLASGSIISKGYTCKNIVTKDDDTRGTCDTDVNVQFNLKEAKLTDNKNFTKMIEVKGTNLIMEFRDIQSRDYLEMKSTELIDLYYIAKALLVSVIDTQENTTYSDWTDTELQEFWDSLSPADLERVLEDFILASPTHELHHKFVCPKCAYTSNMQLKGIFSFF